jgi:hypothetical protein
MTRITKENYWSLNATNLNELNKYNYFLTTNE